MTRGAIVFVLLHPGYARPYRDVIELLAARGHDVHLAFSSGEKDPGDSRLVEELAAGHPRITTGVAPTRGRFDPIAVVAGAARMLADLGRYADPRFARAPKLRARVASTAASRLRLGPPGRAVASTAIRYRATTRLVPAARALERALPPARAVVRWLRGLQPAAVVVSPVVDFGSNQVEYVKGAVALGIPVAVGVASWDNLTNKGLIRVTPDRVFVWNDRQMREAVELHDIPADRVVATGAPKFDEWFARTVSTTPEQFAANVGLSGRFILYVCSSSFVAPDEVGFVRDWLTALRGRSEFAATPVLVRPHPQNAAQWRSADLGAFDDVAVWPPNGAQPDDPSSRAGYYDSLAHSLAVVGVNTSALIEAAIVRREVFTILDPRFTATQEGTLHFSYLSAENGGFLHEAKSFAEHLDQLAAASGGDSESADAFVQAFVRPHGLDRGATPILADAIEDLAGRR